MHKVYKPGEAPQDYNYEETCPRCDSAIPVVIDDDDYEHYQVTCPVCGKPLMLCVLCGWDLSDDGENQALSCDWHPTEDECGECFRCRKKEG